MGGKHTFLFLKTNAPGEQQQSPVPEMSLSPARDAAATPQVWLGRAASKSRLRSGQRCLRGGRRKPSRHRSHRSAHDYHTAALPQRCGRWWTPTPCRCLHRSSACVPQQQGALLQLSPPEWVQDNCIFLKNPALRKSQKTTRAQPESSEQQRAEKALKAYSGLCNVLPSEEGEERRTLTSHCCGGSWPGT